MITTKEIAKISGFSRPTVSLALNQKGQLADSTRRRILEVAQQLGYRSNAAALSMRRGRFNAIGVLLAAEAGVAGLHFNTLWSVEEELAQRDYRLVMGMIPQQGPGAPPLAFLREWAVDALIVHYAMRTPETLVERLRSYRVPSVWINSKLEKNCLYPDDFRSVADATRHLLALGHRRVVYASFRHSEHYSVLDRRLGYELAMQEAGLSPRLLQAHHLPASQRVAFAMQVLSGPDRPTAILTYGGQEDVAPYYLAALQLQLRIPRDLSLIGVDTGIIDLGGIPIGTLSLPMGAMGHQAVQLLMDRIEGRIEEVPARALPLSYEPAQTVAPPCD